MAKQIERDAAEQDILDGLGFDDSDDEFFDAFEEYTAPEPVGADDDIDDSSSISVAYMI